MDKKSAAKYIRKWGFKGQRDYEQYIKEKIRNFEFVGPIIFSIFERKVRVWKQELLSTGRDREIAVVVSPPQDNLVKNPERVLEKIVESHQKHEQWRKKAQGARGDPPIKYHPRKFASAMGDLIRFRIVCNYISDVDCIDKKLQQLSEESLIIKLLKKEDSIDVPYPERRTGHRAYHYNFNYLGEKTPILFEVQVMTQLQHAWDKKDHHLIYEYVRIGRGEEIPLHLRNRMAAMSELLYVADTVFENLRSEIIDIMEKKIT